MHGTTSRKEDSFVTAHFVQRKLLQKLAKSHLSLPFMHYKKIRKTFSYFLGGRGDLFYLNHILKIVPFDQLGLEPLLSFWILFAISKWGRL